MNRNEKKKMMILGGSILQVPAIQKAKELGYEVIVVDYDEAAVGFALADVKLIVSTLDLDEVYRQALIYQPDVVMTSTSDGPVRTAAYVNEKLCKKPDLSYENAKCATIKSDMRRRLKECSVPIPAFYAVHNFEKFKEAAAALNFYCIVKPADNAGSRGVILLTGADEATLLKTYEYSRSNSRDGMVMVEELMTGEEVSVEAMTVDGKTEIIAITDKYTTPLPYFVEIAHSQPCSLDEQMQERIRAVAVQAVEAIGLCRGASHTEVKITPDGPKIVELAARLGGDFITSRLVPLSTGVDMVGGSVLLAAGEHADFQRKWQKGSAIRFLQGQSGVIKSITVDERIHTMQGVEEFVIYKKEGDKVNGTTSSNDRLGHVIASGQTAKEAMETAAKALACLIVEIVPED